MNFTKYDRIQLVLNISLIIATVLNILYMTGVCERWVIFIGLLLAIGSSVMTNLSTGSKGHSMRETVSGSSFLATLTYFTGVAWVITFGVIMFFRVNQNMNV